MGYWKIIIIMGSAVWISVFLFVYINLFVSAFFQLHIQIQFHSALYLTKIQLNSIHLFLWSNLLLLFSVDAILLQHQQQQKNKKKLRSRTKKFMKTLTVTTKRKITKWTKWKKLGNYQCWMMFWVKNNNNKTLEYQIHYFYNKIN